MELRGRRFIKTHGANWFFVRAVTDFPAFVRGFLDWPDGCLLGADAARPVPDELTVPLPEFGELLRPTFVFKEPRPKNPAKPWTILIQELPLATDLDARPTGDDKVWPASPAQRFERLLRDTDVPIGLITTGTQFRLVYKPHGENPGSLTFPVAAMSEIAGRPILAAFHMLLDSERLISAPSDARLPALLARSREYQSSVSTALAGQVLDALYEMLRGFQSADERAHGELLKDALRDNPADVYTALLTVLMRLVFLLYAEDRGVMPTTALYVRNYSIHSLFGKLRADAERYPDTMDHRYGAWAQLLALFRAVHGGCKHPQLFMPARHGYLFDPSRFPFLEGRTKSAAQQSSTIPLVPDGIILRVLSKLLLLDGERLSYRTLDVEQIGSVYETIMGFRLDVARGPTIAIKPAKPHGAPAAINLEELLAAKPADRAKWLLEQTDQKLSADAGESLKNAKSLDDLLAALEKKIARNATPSPVPAGAMVLQPSDERRRSGSHYTPRKMTEPIVRKTLRPILDRLGAHPTPEQILALKICDLAVGSGAFQVETCRQLGDELVSAWHHHRCLPKIPPDEDEVLHARRLVAQRCLYGVDRNPMAVDLAKLSLWLATLAKDHPFTFLDHSFRAGDSLVGLSRKQIEGFHWQPQTQMVLGQEVVAKRMEHVTKVRAEILDAGDDTPPALKEQKLGVADESLDLVRFAGDLVIAAYFGAEKDKPRQALRDQYLGQLADYLKTHDMTKRPTAAVTGLRSGAHPVTPFHWEIEFPEVFRRDNPGFDAFVGNPPFAGKNTMIAGNREGYLDWLKALHTESHGNADVVAHFFRRAFHLMRERGCFGLIATNTIGQGDTRSTGLRWICTHGGTIYAARKRYKWPGQAAVVVSIIWIQNGEIKGLCDLDEQPVEKITAYLVHAGGHDNPAVLKANEDKSFQGPIPLGMGFTFDDTASEGSATPLAEMQRLIKTDSHNAQCIFPYLGAEEFLDSPTQAHSRYVIYFGEMTEHEARRWPALMEIVERKVRPVREQDKRETRRRYWWRFAELAPALQRTKVGHQRLLMHPFTSTYVNFAFVPASTIISGPHNVFIFETYSAFAVLQSRPHEFWTRFFGSSLEDRQRYTPSDCFETYPFPAGWETSVALEAAGNSYYEFRAALMVKNNEGLTKTYNRFHSLEETSPEISNLRNLHAAMDRAVLDAYGWHDIPTDCEFILDYDDSETTDDPDATAPGDTKRKRKKPWRYRWPDEVRDKVLARLLELNAQRAEEERIAGEATLLGKPAKRTARKNAAADTTKELF